MATTTRRRRSTDTRNDPHPLASEDLSIRLHQEATRRGRTGFRINQDPPTTTSHPRTGTTTRADEPSWHQLLGTLLSSQRTDAHPPFTLRRAPGRRLGSNLPEFLAAFRAFRRIPL